MKETDKTFAIYNIDSSNVDFEKLLKIYRNTKDIRIKDEMIFYLNHALSRVFDYFYDGSSDGVADTFKILKILNSIHKYLYDRYLRFDFNVGYHISDNVRRIVNAMIILTKEEKS
jgi:hypothetical protein